MASWFTIQGPYPYPEEYGPKLTWDVYLQERHKNLAPQIKIGDRVFFYELKGTGKLEINNRVYRTPTGRMGLVKVGAVTGAPYHRSINEGLSKTYGPGRTYWSVGIPTNAGDSSGFVSREKVVDILGFANNYYFKGFSGGTGIKLIDEAVAHELLRLFSGVWL